MAVNFREITKTLDNPSGHYKNQGSVYIALPSDYEKAEICPLLLALHGSGREALSYRDVPFYALQRDIAIKCGYVFATVSNGPDTFGLNAGYENVIKLYEYMQSAYKVYKKTALWASSAGGLMMHRFYRSNRDTVNLMLGTFPVYDPQTMPPLKSMLNAFGAKDNEELREKTLFVSPGMFPNNVYSGANIVIAHGKNDVTVPIEQSIALNENVQRAGGDMVLVKKPGGHSTENFDLYDTPLFEEALAETKNSLRHSFP